MLEKQCQYLSRCNPLNLPFAKFIAMSGLVISKISFISFARLKSQINYIFARVMLLLTLGNKSKQHGQSYSKMFFGRSFNELGKGDYYKTCAELSMTRKISFHEYFWNESCKEPPIIAHAQLWSCNHNCANIMCSVKFMDPSGIP